MCIRDQDGAERSGLTTCFLLVLFVCVYMLVLVRISASRHSNCLCPVLFPFPGHSGYCWINLNLQIAISKCSMLGNLHILSFLLWSESCGIQMSAMTKFEYIKGFLLHTWVRVPDVSTCSRKLHSSLVTSASFILKQIKKIYLLNETKPMNMCVLRTQKCFFLGCVWQSLSESGDELSYLPA